jgi:hypothetical protein
MRNLASVISRSLKIGIFSLALLMVATPVIASTTFPEPLPFNIQRTHRNWSTEYVEAQATITTPTNQDVLIPGEDVEVSLEHEVQKYVLTLNDEVKEFQLGNHMAVELLVNDEVVIVA